MSRCPVLPRLLSSIAVADPYLGGYFSAGEAAGPPAGHHTEVGQRGPGPNRVAPVAARPPGRVAGPGKGHGQADC